MKKMIILSGILALTMSACSKNDSQAVKPAAATQVEYFRIKQVGLDGTVVYSPIRMVIVNGN